MTKITPLTAEVQRTVLAIKDRLAEASVNEVVGHGELQALVSPAVQKQIGHYVLVQRAQRLLNAENGAVFATVRKEGYRRLAHTTGADYASDLSLLRIRRQSQRGQKTTTMAIMFANDATDSDRRRVYQKLASLGLIEHLTRRKSVQTMPDAAPTTQLDPVSQLRAMLQEAAE